MNCGQLRRGILCVLLATGYACELGTAGIATADSAAATAKSPEAIATNAKAPGAATPDTAPNAKSVGVTSTNAKAGGAPVPDAAVQNPGAPEPLSAFPKSLLAIRTLSGKVLNFMVWTADRPSRQEQGLMFVRDMDDHAGMLFVFATDEQISMWMKNTYLSLDMLFIDADGRIEGIAARTTPFSLKVITAPGRAHAVLELKGGISEQLGIHVGDLVLHKSLARVK